MKRKTHVYIYDIETFIHDWVIVFQEYKSGFTTVLHNDTRRLRSFLTEHANDIFVGFNNKNFDDWLITAMMNGATPEDVNSISQFIVAGNMAFEHPLLKGKPRYQFITADLKQDMQMNMRLKTIEGHLGRNIVESSVDFDIQRVLTPEELEEVIYYCKEDVEMTRELVKLRSEYLRSKVELANLSNRKPLDYIGMTNAKICASFLNARPQLVKLERECTWSAKIHQTQIPKAVMDFFNRTKDESLSDDEVFSYKEQIMLSDGKTAPTYGFGGIHFGGTCHLDTRTSLDDIIIRNYDVASLYPNIMIKHHLLPQPIVNKEIYENTLKRRLSAKKLGLTATSNALKLVLNTTYGCTGNQYNMLYDPYTCRSVCITGQVLLTMLVELYIEALKDELKIIQINTDGVMIAFPKDKLPLIDRVNKLWESMTEMTLEEDEIDAIFQKDVNNYIALFSNGKVKVKGGFLSQGINSAGAWSVNNNKNIVKKAIIDFFISGISPDYTIIKCSDPLEFQMITNSSSKYRNPVHIIEGKEIPVQRVNRVYATNEHKYGRLYHTHKERGNRVLIPDLPTHCLIDNKNEIKIEQINKHYYIDEAFKKIKNFKGEE